MLIQILKHMSFWKGFQKCISSKIKPFLFYFSRTNPISMFFQLRELEQWLGLNVVEIWVNLVSLTVFSVLLTLKLDEVILHIETPGESNYIKSLLLLHSVKSPEQLLYDLTWWQVFSPLFISDALNCYFCTIVWIRMYVEGANGKIYRFVILILLDALRIRKSLHSFLWINLCSPFF